MHYSLGKTQSLRNKIATFVQYLTETKLKAFECFNEYTRAVPHQKFPKEDLIQKFYQGLTMASRTIIDPQREDPPSSLHLRTRSVPVVDGWPLLSDEWLTTGVGLTLGSMCRCRLRLSSCCCRWRTGAEGLQPWGASGRWRDK
jgi:hypothetical protein